MSFSCCRYLIMAQFTRTHACIGFEKSERENFGVWLLRNADNIQWQIFESNFISIKIPTPIPIIFFSCCVCQRNMQIIFCYRNVTQGFFRDFAFMFVYPLSNLVKNLVLRLDSVAFSRRLCQNNQCTSVAINFTVGMKLQCSMYQCIYNGF